MQNIVKYTRSIPLWTQNGYFYPNICLTGTITNVQKLEVSSYNLSPQNRLLNSLQVYTRMPSLESLF